MLPCLHSCIYVLRTSGHGLNFMLNDVNMKSMIHLVQVLE